MITRRNFLKRASVALTALGAGIKPSRQAQGDVVLDSELLALPSPNMPTTLFGYPIEWVEPTETDKGTTVVCGDLSTYMYARIPLTVSVLKNEDDSRGYLNKTFQAKRARRSAR